MAEDIYRLIRRIRFGNLDPRELEQIYADHHDHYGIKLHLVQCPRFPVRSSLTILSELFTPDLVRVIGNTQANPFIRKSGENEFILRYAKIPLGEKVSLLRRLPAGLLGQLTFEKDKRCLAAIINNPHCSEAVVINFITRSRGKKDFYDLLIDSKWIKRPGVIEAVLKDRYAPIKAFQEVIPLLPLSRLEKMLRDPGLHESIKKNIRYYLNKRDKR